MKIIVKMAQIEGERDLPPSRRSWYYVEVADNGEPTATSEFYDGTANAMRAAKSKAEEFSEFTPVELEKEPRDG